MRQGGVGGGVGERRLGAREHAGFFIGEGVWGLGFTGVAMLGAGREGLGAGERAGFVFRK